MIEIIDRTELNALPRRQEDAGPDGVVDVVVDVGDAVDEADPTTADILHEVIQTVEQYAWMVSAELQKPRKRQA